MTTIFAFHYLVTSLLPGSGKATAFQEADKPLTTVSSVKYLSGDEAAKRVPVLLTGVVTGVPPGWKGFFVEDETGGIYCEPLDAESEKTFWPIHVGELVQLQGVSAPGHRNSFLTVSKVLSRSVGPLPDPKLTTVRQLIDDVVDADFVRVRGQIVGLVNIAGQMEYGLLADGVEAQVLHVGFRIDPKVYELAEVEVCGIVIPQEAQARKVKIIVPDEPSFKMLATDLEVLNATPLNSIRNLFKNHAPVNRVVRVSADLYSKDAQHSWLIGGGFGIRWNHANILLPSNTRSVELIGILKGTDSRRWIDYSTVLSTSENTINQNLGASTTTEKPSVLVNRLVTLTGTFWDSNIFNSDAILSFDVDDSKLTCRFIGSLGEAELSHLRRGAKYEITGLLTPVVNDSLDATEMLVRSVSDIVEVSGPPWPTRITLYIVSLLSTGLAFGLATATYQWLSARKANERLELAKSMLSSSNEELEARVADRTKELMQSNSKLVEEAA
ncbi:MAG: hypothetical protein U0930_26035, partial [Pirellulales bacterium]